MVLRVGRGGAGAERRDEGVVAVVTALVLPLVVIPLLALVVDLGVSRTANGRATTAAESAALAAALELKKGSSADVAIEVAKGLVETNAGIDDPALWASCLDQHPLPAGTAPTPGDCVSVDPATRQVRVTVPPRQVPSVFSGVLGTTPPSVSASATATWAPPVTAPAGGSAPPCALCVVTFAGASGLFAGGLDRTSVVGGDVAVGGAITIGTGGSLTADRDRQIVYGGPTASGTISPAPVVGSAPADPLAPALAAVQAAAAAAPRGTSGACGPGVYADFSACTSFTGNGVYVLTGNPYLPFVQTGVTLKYGLSNAVIYVTCARLYVSPPRPQTCSTPGSTVKPSLLASGSQTIGGSAAFDGLALAFDPTAQATQRLANSGTLQVNGSVDGPATTFRDATSCNGRLVVNGRLVAGAVTLTRCTTQTGSPALTVNAPAAGAGGGGSPAGPPVRLSLGGG